MEWIEHWKSQAAPLVAVCQRALKEYVCATEFSRGVQGLVQLVRCVDRWALRQEVSEEEDRCFVEGIGALYAVLVLEHIGSGEVLEWEDLVRVRLGKYGWLNPFAVVEQALHAPSAKQAFVQATAEAEAEAAGVGPLSRVLEMFETLLAEKFAQLRIEKNFETRIWLTGAIEVDVARVVSATRREDMQAVRASVEKVISLLPGSAPQENSKTTWDQVQAQLFPRLVSSQFFSEQTHTLSAETSKLAMESLDRTLAVALVIRQEGRLRYVKHIELLNWRVSFAEAYPCALSNLASSSNRLQIEKAEHYVALRAGDGLAASRALLPRFESMFASVPAQKISLGIPHRDVLYVLSNTEHPSLEKLRARVQDDYRRAPHRISPNLYEYKEERLSQISL